MIPDPQNKEATSFQESVDQSQIILMRAAVEVFVALANGLNQKQAPPIKIDAKMGAKKFSQYSQGVSSDKSPIEVAMTSARKAHKNGENPGVLISLVRASPAVQRIEAKQGAARADAAAATIGTEAVRRNVQAQKLTSDPALARSLQTKPVRAHQPRRSR